MKEFDKQREDKLIKAFDKQFPKMIAKGQCIYVEPIVKHLPNTINRLQEKWEVEFKYDETGSEIRFMCPKYKK